MAKPANAPASSLSCRMRAVPWPWLVVPIDRPRSIGVRILNLLSSHGPKAAPVIPVNTAKTAAREGAPPICSATLIATGAVIDFVLSEVVSARSTPAAKQIARAVNMPAAEPQTTPVTMGKAAWRTFR